MNDDAALAQRIGADGLHLPARSLMAADRRPDFEWVGASCHSRAELEKAAALELDYALLGAVQPTQSHPERAALGWAAFGELVARLPLPVLRPGRPLRRRAGDGQGRRRPRRRRHPGDLGSAKGRSEPRPQNSGRRSGVRTHLPPHEKTPREACEAFFWRRRGDGDSVKPAQRIGFVVEGRLAFDAVLVGRPGAQIDQATAFGTERAVGAVGAPHHIGAAGRAAHLARLGGLARSRDCRNVELERHVHVRPGRAGSRFRRA